MFMDIINGISLLALVAVGLLGIWLIYMTVRKEPPFKPGTEPKHSWDLTREERVAQIRADIARRRDEALEKDASLSGFDPKLVYPAYEGMPSVSRAEVEAEKIRISDLITSMTINKASHWELARAVRHSMVVMDAEKYQLNYIQSEIDNGIAQLKEKYL